MLDSISVFAPFWLCFKKPGTTDSNSSRSPPAPQSRVQSKICQFCDVHSLKRESFDIVWEDDDYVAFRDHNPSAVHHIQVIPKVHIDSVKSLTRADVNVVDRLQSISHNILDGLGIPISDRRIGFHIPPFNTVNHLHLHVQALPYKSFARRMKYPIAAGIGPYTKGLSWFVEARQALRILDQGGQIRISPC
ncbi:HIT-like protein [Hygrophoropsis aurantiaca]|uniref:HIT-like protein n=1 Tax=Hygrophoropsis aurantiaca TaxID=72124 RepID=A0ACB8ADG6_9AGAM|nr:HIT-like protein [Hygrophoropsis aurantiaca]